MNINMRMQKLSANAIYGGFNLKIISESISDVGAQGIAVDAGIQYVTGEKEISFWHIVEKCGADHEV